MRLMMLLNEKEIDLMILELKLRVMSGVEVVRQVGLQLSTNTSNYSYSKTII